MTPQIIRGRMMPYQKTAAAWLEDDDVLLPGERGRETDTGREKVGDGITPWSGRPYEVDATTIMALVIALVDAYFDENPPTGSTDLAVSRTGTALTVASSTGTDAVLPPADNANAGVMTAAMQLKLAAIEASADVTDAANVEAAGAVMKAATSTAGMGFVDDDATLAANSALKLATQRAVRAYVAAKFAEFIGAAPAELDTWLELVAEIQENESALAGIITALAGKQAKFFTGTVSTAAATVTKAVTVTGTPVAGDYLTVTFTNGSTATSPTLSINGVGAYPLRAPAGGTSTQHVNLTAGATVTLLFDGANLFLPGATQNTTYSIITDPEAANPGHATGTLITGQRLQAALAAERQVTRILLGATIDGDANTLQDIGIGSLKTTGTPSESTVLHGDGQWKTAASSGANNYLIWEGDLGTGVGTWPARPTNDLPTIWIGGVAPGNYPPEHAAGDFWQPAIGDSADFGAVVEALQTLSLAAGKIPYFSSGSEAGVLDLKTTVAALPSDTAVLTEAAVKNYIDRLPTQPAKTGSYNVVSTDQGTVLEYNSTSPATFTVTNDFVAGNVVGFRSINTGILTIAAGSGVTLNSYNGAFKLAGQWAEASINFRLNAHAILSGQLVA